MAELTEANNKALWVSWGDLWNGDLALADQIIATDFLAHAAPITGVGESVVRGRAGLLGWIGGIRAAIPDLSFTTVVGPISEDYMLVGRWQADGTYGGGVPGLPATAVGRRVSFTGTDILRIAGGQLAEYWANADSLLFMQQLGAFPPAR